MNSPVQKIKERLSIVDVVSSYLSLEKAGKNYKARCPFHNEKTPSFFVSPDRGSFYCFGCNAKGDIFTFVEKFEGVDFLGALRILAEKAGVNLSEYKSEIRDKDSVYYEIMEEASLFFQNNLKNEDKVYKYLISRGLNKKSIEDFKIGYSLNSWDSLVNHLVKKGYQIDDILTVGLIKKKDSDGRITNRDHHYDRFRNRIMFPINDSSGRVIAFSGRIYEDKKNGIEKITAKYINSPETPLYNKASVLYGIDKAKNSIRKSGFTIMVEGQLDLILSHQFGFTNTVAVSGTALTDSETNNENKINNLGLVKRLSPNIIFAYDGDDAGLRASNRSAMIALSLDMQVKLAILPEGKDPADIILENKEDWKNIIKNSVNIITFHLDRIIQESNNLRKRGQLVKEKIFPFLQMIKSSIELNAYINEIYKKTGITETAINEDFKKYQKSVPVENIFTEEEKENKFLKISRREKLEKKYIGVVFSELLNKDKKEEIEFLKNKIEKDLGSKVMKTIYDKYDPYKEQLCLEAELWYGDRKNSLIKDFTEIVYNLEEEIYKEITDSLLLRINQKEKTKDKNEIEKDIINYQKIVEKIEKIKNKRLE